MTDTTYNITGDWAVPSNTLVDVTPAKKTVANKYPTNSNHDSSLDDKSYNGKSDFKTDKVEEEKDKVDKQSSEKEEEEEVSNLIEDLRETNLDTTLAPMIPIMYDWFDEYGRQKLTVDFLVHSLPQSHFRPKVDCNGKHLELGIVVPEFFLSHTWLIESAQSKTKMGARVVANNHNVTAFTKAVDELKAQSDYEKTIFYQHVKLPF